MSSKGNPKRISNGEKISKPIGDESKSVKSSGISSGSASTPVNNEDDYEKGKKTRNNINRDELDADRKAVEDLEKWNY